MPGYGQQAQVLHLAMQQHVALAAIQKFFEPAFQLRDTIPELDGKLLSQPVANLAVRNEACGLQQELVGIEDIVKIRKTQRARLGIVIRCPCQVDRTAEVSREARFDQDL